MNRNFYKSTTALVMTLSLFQPVVAMAQEPVTIECTPQLITDGVPCLDPLTKLLVAPQADLKKDNKPDKADKAPKPLAAEEAQAAAAAAEAEKAAAKALADEAKAAADAAKAEAEAATAEAEKAGALAAGVEAAAAAEAERAKAADDSAAAKALADAEAAAAAEAAATAEAAAAAQAATAAEAKQKADDAAARAQAEAAKPLVLPPCDPLLPGVVCGAAEVLPEAPQASVPDVPTAAPETEAAKAADSVVPEADVVTRTVTESDHRSSRQEFDNAVSAAPKADSGGLTNLEKAGLLLLGAVVVGAILKNNEKVVANTGDRVIVQDQYGDYRVYKDDDVLLMQPGATVRTETFGDGSTRSFVTRADGTQIVTIRDAQGRVQRRVHVGVDGLETTLIDDTRTVEVVDLRTLPKPEPRLFNYVATADNDALRRALLAADQRQADRSFSLRQIRDIREVRALALEINLEAITFETGSAAIPPVQAERLRQLGSLMADLVALDPREVFLIEGHTDAIGEPAYNLALSDRRAETVALALSEYFGVPPENMVVQGYGEQFLKIRTLDAERLNRRVAVRRITGLLN
jgi:outer membrane protein OmpA-like peptidoglycan-associated protein